MTSWRQARVDEDSSLALLAEYFSARAQSFPASQGEYRTVFPNAEQFVPPHGVFLVIEGEDLSGDAADVGCGGIRRLDDAAGETGADHTVRFEVKHLWVQPHLRGTGLGRRLLEELESRARGFGARQLVLDTNESQAAAASLYRSSGYEEIAPYNDNANATNWFTKIL